MRTLEIARVCFSDRRWTDAVEAFSTIDETGAATLEAGDLEALAVAAYLTGADDTSASAFARAHQARLDDGDPRAAIADGFWLGVTMMLRGEMAHASGWFGRIGRVVEEQDPDGPGPGYLLVPAALGALHSGDATTALDHARAARELARTHGQPDLEALAACAMGQAHVAANEPAEAVRLFDESMVAVTADEVSPIPAGIVYCAVIAHCIELFDVARAAEWTESLYRWCEQQPDLVPYRGQCLVHRSQILQLRGRWQAAEAEADAALERLQQPPHPALGLACYQRAELHRLRGEHEAAASAYVAASDAGHDPQPGLALLRVAQGDLAGGRAMISRAIAESSPSTEPAVLAAATEIFVTAGDTDAATHAATLLGEATHAHHTAIVHALAAMARGRVALSGGEPIDALHDLRSALAQFRELQLPYEAARTRELIGIACEAAGDLQGCALELEAAQHTYEELGAATDLRRLSDRAATSTDAASTDAGGLTDRELEVLRLVAEGRTNRDIGEALHISEHTVARHVQNTFTKLGVSSRAAATSHAYEHGLL